MRGGHRNEEEKQGKKLTFYSHQPFGSYVFQSGH